MAIKEFKCHNSGRTAVSFSVERALHIFTILRNFMGIFGRNYDAGLIEKGCRCAEGENCGVFDEFIFR